MTALEVIAKARAQGLTLTRVGDRLHFRGPAGALTIQLREELLAAKPEIMGVLRDVTSRQTIVVGAFASAYGRLATRAASIWPEGGLMILQRHRPELYRGFQRAEEHAEEAGCAYARGEAGWEVFSAAVQLWENHLARAAEVLQALCATCGGVLADPGRDSSATRCAACSGTKSR